MRKEAERWLRQAEADLKACKDSLKNSNFEWSCFQAQQSAEKALKSYLYNLGYTSIITHSIKILVRECAKRQGDFLKLEKISRVLDTYYIPTRYPNGLDKDIAPADYYDKGDADKCLRFATSILKTVKELIQK